MPFPLAAIPLIAGAAMKLFGGGGQKRKAKKLLSEISYPDQTVPGEVFENKALAESMAVTGMPGEEYSRAMRQIERQQLNSLRRAGDRRGALMVLPHLQEKTDDALIDLEARSAGMKLENQRTRMGAIMGANREVADWKDKVWGWNKRDKYQRDYNYAMQLLGTGNQNQYAGMDQGITGITELLQGLFGRGGRRSSGGYAGIDGGDEGMIHE